MKEFFKAFFSKKVGFHFLAVALVFMSLIGVVYFSLDSYTNHGKKVEVPNVKKKSFKAAKQELSELGLEIQVTDTLYLKNLPADIVLEQMPMPGKAVKPGRVIYVVINAGHSPERVLPDLVDNSSVREAKAQLLSLGFKRVEVQYIAGEKDWVYGLKYNGKDVKNGTKLSVDSKLVLIVGDGSREPSDSVEAVSPMFYFDGNLHDDYVPSGGGQRTVSGNSSKAESSSGSTSSYSQEDVEHEISTNLDADIQNMINEKRQREANQKIENGAANAPE